MAKPSKIVIVSAGIIGLVTAYVARRENPKAKITVLERMSGPGMVTSARHAGHLTPFEGASTMVVAPPKKLTHQWDEGGWLLNDVYPVEEFTPHDRQWRDYYLGYAARSSPEKRKITDLVARFCTYSVKQWQLFMRQHPTIKDESNFQNEMLRLYSPEAIISAFTDDMALFENSNYIANPVPLVNEKAAKLSAKYEPRLSKQLLAQNIIAFQQMGCSVDTSSFCKALADMLVNKCDVRIKYDTQVTKINISGNVIVSLSTKNLRTWENSECVGEDPTQYIFSPGTSTDLFPEREFKRPPVTSISGVSITLFPNNQSMIPSKALKYVTHDMGIIVSSVVYNADKMKRGMRLGGGMWFTGNTSNDSQQLTFEHKTVQTEIKYLWDIADRLFPNTFSPSQNKNEIICRRPASPDFMPIIDYLQLADGTPVKNGIFSGGQFFNGSSSCFASAEIAIALANGNRSGLSKPYGCQLSRDEVAMFGMKRFA